jgi:BCD family chlorophyll transporter-like MFS transporter
VTPAPLSWLGIVRLGLVQTALGAIVVLMTSAINRVMVVELALAASLPGALVALHYAVQMMRPRMGHASDVGGRRTPWIVGGMATLGLGGTLAAAATGLMHDQLGVGIALSIVAFVLVGLGVGASGTALLALLTARTAPERRPAAATIVWVMMILGFVVTAATTGRLLDPYSPARLLAVTAGVCAIALVVACLAVRGVELARPAAAQAARGDFRAAIRAVWAEGAARRFAVFVFVSMLAYSAQDLILEPFAGLVFGMTLGQSTSASAVQHGGVLAGMIVVGVLGTALGRGSARMLRGFIVGGCLLAAASLVGLAAAGVAGQAALLRPGFFALGLGNGLFAAAAIATMMQLAARDGEARAGTRLGVWGAAQAIAFGLGGLAGAAVLDLATAILRDVPAAFAAVFLTDALLFLASAALAVGVARTATPRLPNLAGAVTP